MSKPKCESETGHEWEVEQTYVRHGNLVQIDKCWECGNHKIIDENGTRYEGPYWLP